MKEFTFMVPCWVPITVEAENWDEAASLVFEGSPAMGVGEPEAFEFANKERA